VKITLRLLSLLKPIDYQGVVNAHKMSTNLIDVKQSVDLYGDAAIQYVPQTSQFQNVPGYTYRFGKNQQELGDFSTQGDGLEFRNMPWGGNEILMQVNDITPTIEIHRVKNPGVETLVVTSERQSEQDPGNKIITIDDAGLHVQRNDKNINLLTPGNALSVGLLMQGFQTHKFTLDQAWTSGSTETDIEIYSATSAAEFLHIQNLEVTLDDRSQPNSVAEVNARVFVKRWGVYRNTYLRLWLVLGVDLRGDSSVATGRYLRVSFNNKTLL
jgi:riboflavin synthase